MRENQDPRERDDQLEKRRKDDETWGKRVPIQEGYQTPQTPDDPWKKQERDEDR